MFGHSPSYMVGLSVTLHGRSVGHFGQWSHGRSLYILQGWSTYEGCRLTDRPTDHLTDSDWPSVALISAEIAMPHTLYLARFSSFNILLQSWDCSLTFLYSINKQKVNAQYKVIYLFLQELKLWNLCYVIPSALSLIIEYFLNEQENVGDKFPLRFNHRNMIYRMLNS